MIGKLFYINKENIGYEGNISQHARNQIVSLQNRKDLSTFAAVFERYRDF